MGMVGPLFNGDGWMMIDAESVGGGNSSGAGVDGMGDDDDDDSDNDDDDDSDDEDDVVDDVNGLLLSNGDGVG